MLLDLLWITLLVGLATLPFLTPALDIKLLSLFYHPGSNQAWPHQFDPLWRFLYMFGPWPALLTSLTALGVIVVARYRKSLARWRRHAALIFLTLALGPGLFINTIFKDHWGRPRPWQVTELGGTMTYQCFFEKGVGGRGKSFPCGHSSMGYFFIVFYFLAKRRHKVLAAAAFAGAALYGTLIGVSRMAAGGHFASDVLWSAFFPAIVAWFLYYFILKISEDGDSPTRKLGRSILQSRWLLWIALPLALGAFASVLLGTPAFSEVRYNMHSPKGPPALRLDVRNCRVTLKATPELTDRIIITGEIKGFGWPLSRIRHSAIWNQTNGTWVLDFACKPKGHFSELDGELTIQIPPGTAVERTSGKD
jgi:membrane-associated PAP2 superfamily phosphatase